MIFCFVVAQSSLAKVISTCYGTTANGRLEKGVKLPSKGKNFKAYSWMGQQLGRTYLHSSVHDILIAAYKSLEKKAPSKVFMYAETGFASGGKFKPHKTHQNGLSLDHMVPVLRGEKSVHLPTSVFNRFGYDIEFDLTGKYESYKIDYEALALLIGEIHKQALKRKLDLWRVIFDPKMTPSLYKTSYGEYLKENIMFSKKRSWVRHDEHIHIDFKVPRKSLDKKPASSL
ncbi:MAG: penicillin-insensitive murein endopeptidase [Bdellovibrionales bacterium]|nr:penicillin-insensitive murein endopeptidase [Bdellovibrionales bacterium]